VPALQNFNGSDFSVRLLLPGQFSHQVEQFSPDIIHSHHPFLLGDAALRTARLRRLPLVFTHHTLYERYTHYVPLDSPTLKRFVIELASCFANLCQVVIAPSQSIAQIIARRGVVSPCKVVPTGIDTEFFASGNGVHFRKKIKIPHRAAVIGHLGRLAFEKNLAYLAEAACRACVENDNVYFLVAGKGPALETIQNIFARDHRRNRLLLAGELQGPELADCYAAMDLFCFASTSETQGMVLAEAMAAGKPVVALDAPGVREVVDDRSNGFLLPETTAVEDFSDALAQALCNPRRLMAWSERARETARRFSRAASAEKLEDVYRQVLATAWERIHEPVDTWDKFQESLKAEWDLVSSKFGAAIHATITERAEGQGP